MRAKPRNMAVYLDKQAVLQDKRAERAEVRRLRAKRLGNKREMEGAMRTIADAKASAKMLRMRISEYSR